MKAALNGVPSLSVLDGWWVEGWIEGVTGWAIPDSDNQEHEVASLYDRLESTILPLYYGDPEQWRTVMRSTIALNGSFFNTHRMLQEYISNAYYPDKDAIVLQRRAGARSGQIKIWSRRCDELKRLIRAGQALACPAHFFAAA